MSFGLRCATAMSKASTTRSVNRWSCIDSRRSCGSRRPRRPHHACDPLRADGVTELDQVDLNARSAVRATRCGMAPLALGGQQRVLLLALRRLAVNPRVVAAARDVEQAEHEADGVHGPVRLHEPERLGGVRVASWANQAAASLGSRDPPRARQREPSAAVTRLVTGRDAVEILHRRVVRVLHPPANRAVRDAVLSCERRDGAAGSDELDRAPLVLRRVLRSSILHPCLPFRSSVSTEAGQLQPEKRPISIDASDSSPTTAGWCRRCGR